MLRVAAAIAAATVVALVASAAVGQGQNPEGRFQLTAEEDGFLRLDTQTGALSFCQLTEGRWICTPVETGDTADLTVIVDRLTAVEAALAALALQIDASADNAINAQLVAIREQLTDLAEQVAGAAPAIDEDLAGQINALAADQAALAEAIANLGVRDGRDDIAALTAAAEERMAVLEAAIATGPEDALTRIYEELQTLRTLNNELAGVLDAAIGGNADIGIAIAAIGERLNAVETAVTEIGAQENAAVAELAALLTDLNDRLETQQAQIGDLAAALDLTAPPSATDDVLAALAARQAAIEQQLAALNEIIEAATAPIPDLVDALAALGERQAAIQSELAALAGIIDGDGSEEMADALATLAARQAAMGEEVAALIDAVTAEPTAPPAIVEQLALIAEDVALLREETAFLQTRMDELNEAVDRAPRIDIEAGLARIEAELTALKEALAALTAEQQPPVSGGDAMASPEAERPIAEPDSETETTGFGEQLFLRLEALVQDLRHGLGAE